MPKLARPKAQREPRILSPPYYRGPIPCVAGPKLHEFKYRNAAIEFLSLLSDPDTEGQAHVFEVRIRSQIYALKVFTFYEDDDDEVALHEFQRDIVSLDLLHAHADPFYNECRAYGRLKEKNLDGKVAVRCHGYTTLPAAIEVELERRFDYLEWDRDDYDLPMKERAPFRAIVKDLIRDDIPLTHRVVKKMKRDLLQIRKQGVYTCDIKARNYKGGLLLDFSVAITEPNYLFHIKPDFQVEFYKNRDLFQFDNMIEDEKVKTWVRAMPDENMLRKLRTRDYLQEFYGWSISSLAG